MTYTRTGKQRQRRQVEQLRSAVTDRCSPTLHVHFRDQQVVRIERHHAARNQPSARSAPKYGEPEPRGITAPFDEGCRGQCVGTREQLPLTYFDGR